MVANTKFLVALATIDGDRSLYKPYTELNDVINGYYTLFNLNVNKTFAKF